MKTKSEGKSRPSTFTSATVASPSFSVIPHLSDQHNRPEPQPDPKPVDLFDKSICICCDTYKRGEEGVLACHVSECPVTVHATCLRAEPKFDDSGNFYCPYCWYKRALDTCLQLRHKATAAKNALSQFLDNNAHARQKPVQDMEVERVEKTQLEANKDEFGKEDELVEHTEMEENNNQVSRGKCVEEPQSEKNNDEQGMDECMERAESEENKDEQGTEECAEKAQSEENKDEQGMEEGLEKAQSEENNDQQGMEEGLEKAQSEENKDEQGMEEGLEKAQSEENNDQQGREERIEDTGSEENRDGGTVSVSVTGTSVSEEESEGLAVKKRKDQKKVAYMARKKSLVPQKRKHHTTRGKTVRGVVEEEATSTRTLRPLQGFPAKGKKQTLLPAKRRRLLWTAEEEEVLKEGVLKFSTENQNIPWRKILEFGCRVFDKTRTPVDLKDKWRNISKGCK